MKQTKRDFAQAIGFKLGKLKQLRESKKGFKCQFCFTSLPKGSYYFAEIVYQELSKPIDTGRFVLKMRPIVVGKICLSCAKIKYPTIFKKGS